MGGGSFGATAAIRIENGYSPLHLQTPDCPHCSAGSTWLPIRCPRLPHPSRAGQSDGERCGSHRNANAAPPAPWGGASRRARCKDERLGGRRHEAVGPLQFCTGHARGLAATWNVCVSFRASRRRGLEAPRRPVHRERSPGATMRKRNAPPWVGRRPHAGDRPQPVLLAQPRVPRTLISILVDTRAPLCVSTSQPRTTTGETVCPPREEDHRVTYGDLRPETQVVACV